MKNYTSLEVMKASEVVGSFAEVKFDSEEEFREAVKKGVVYKAFEPPKNATMLKFRYYTPKGTLIEQNNVPVVYDGTAVKDIITYYYLTDKASGIKFNKATWESDGWKKNEVQNVTKDKRFLWTCTETLYSNTPEGDTGLLTDPCITSVYGEKGEKGDTGSTGNGISSVEEYYAVSSSNTNAPTEFDTKIPTMTATNKYLWNLEDIIYTNGVIKHTDAKVIGVYGDKGTDGIDGLSIGEIINYYLATASSSGVTTSTSGWTTTVQSVSSSKKYLWNYEVIKYSDGTVASTSMPCIIGAYGDTASATNENLLHDSKNLTKTFTNTEFRLFYVNGTVTKNAYNGFSSRTVANSSSNYIELLEWQNFTIPLGTTYTVSFFAKGTNLYCYLFGNSGYVNNKSTTIRKNGEVIENSSKGDGCAIITLTNNWQKYEVTWQNGTSGDDTIKRRLLFRVLSGQTASVCGVKFEKGDTATNWCPHIDEYQGKRGEKYLGHYTDSQSAYTDNTPDLFSGDYYLNTQDSYIYVYIEETNYWAKITDFSDYRYNQSINDIFEAIESSTQKETFIKAKKIWVQNIAAAVARTETLFSNKITLTQGTDLDGNTTGGIIQSANYKSGTAGWKIDYDGNAEFNNATVRGKIYATDGEFKGAITGGTISGGTITGTEIKGGSININDNFIVESNGATTIKQNCSIGGYINQGVGFINLGIFGIKYYSSSVSQKAFSLITSFWEVERVAEGRYRIYFHEDWVYCAESPLKYMFENYPPSAYRSGIDFNTYYDYFVQAVPIFACDTYYSSHSETKDDMRYTYDGVSLKNPVFTQTIRCGYVNSAYVGITGGQSFSENYGFTWTTSPNGKDSLAIDIVFTDNQCDELIDPGYAVFNLNIYFMPDLSLQYKYSTDVLPFGLWTPKSFETKMADFIKKNGTYRCVSCEFHIRLASGSYIKVSENEKIYYSLITINNITYNVFSFGNAINTNVVTSSLDDNSKLITHRLLITSTGGTYLDKNIQLQQSICFKKV